MRVALSVAPHSPASSPSNRSPFCYYKRYGFLLVVSSSFIIQPPQGFRVLFSPQRSPSIASKPYFPFACPNQSLTPPHIRGNSEQIAIVSDPSQVFTIEHLLLDLSNALEILLVRDLQPMFKFLPFPFFFSNVVRYPPRRSHSPCVR